jgi:hypothetical protein
VNRAEAVTIRRVALRHLPDHPADKRRQKQKRADRAEPRGRNRQKQHGDQKFGNRQERSQNGLAKSSGTPNSFDGFFRPCKSSSLPIPAAAKTAKRKILIKSKPTSILI